MVHQHGGQVAQYPRQPVRGNRFTPEQHGNFLTGTVVDRKQELRGMRCFTEAGAPVSDPARAETNVVRAGSETGAPMAKISSMMARRADRCALSGWFYKNDFEWPVPL
jgi:hypothetical protein